MRAWFPSKLPRRPRSHRPQVEVLETRFVPSAYSVGPLVQVSQDDPFAACTADDTTHQPGRLFPDAEVEPRISVDPNDPTHMIGVWQQDRWSDGGARGLVAGVTFDSGQDWQEIPLPGYSACTGGSTNRASDVWVSFSPDGSVYTTSLSLGSASGETAVLVDKSYDGGLTWTDPTTLIDDTDPRFFNDKETVTADPTDSNYAYVLWDRIGGQGGRPEMFSRTTDGGQTWETPRPIFNGGRIDSHIVVLPDGTLVDLINSGPIYAMRSEDKGATWDPPVQITRGQSIGVRDPDTGQGIRTSANAIIDGTVDPNTGNIYLVWQDARFNGRQHDAIAFSMSTDGGFTWSSPTQVNQTPTDIPVGDQQAFTASVQVAADGTIGVSYYDFRNNDPQPGLLTDYWFVPGTLNDSGGVDWGNEVQLTDQSFNMETAPDANGLFVGDYQGLEAADTSFVTFFGQTHDSDPGSIFFRTIDPAGGSPHGGGRVSHNAAPGAILGTANENLAGLLVTSTNATPSRALSQSQTAITGQAIAATLQLNSVSQVRNGGVIAMSDGSVLDSVFVPFRTNGVAESNWLTLGADLV